MRGKIQLIDGCLLPILLGRCFGNLGLALLDGAQGPGLLHFGKCRMSGSKLSTLHSPLSTQKEMFGFLLGQQIDIAIDRFFSATRLDVLQRLTTLKGNRCGNTRNLHHVEFAVATGYELCRSIADARHVDREDGHATRGDG